MKFYCCTFTYTADNDLVPVRIPMDVESQCSYLSNELKIKLKLKFLKQESLTVTCLELKSSIRKNKCDLDYKKGGIKI